MRIKLQRGFFAGTFPISQYFGENPQSYAQFNMKGHNGVDYALISGTELYSCIHGQVTEVAYDKNGYGKYIKIENEYCGVLYAHMKTLSGLAIGTEVTPGQMLGVSGNTGNSTGPHLHFGVFPKPRDRANGYAGYINPFDRDLIEWFDSLDAKTDQERIEELEEEVVKYKRQAESREIDMKRAQAETVEVEKRLKGENKGLQDALKSANNLLIADAASVKKMVIDEKTWKLEEKELIQELKDTKYQLSTLEIAYTDLKERKAVKVEMAKNNQKMWYTSKTVWVNAFALIAAVLQAIRGEAIFSAELQLTLLSVVNFFLRSITKEEIVWK